MRGLPAAAALVAVAICSLASAQYESSFGIRAVRGCLHLDPPAHTVFVADVSSGAASSCGYWTAEAIGGDGRGAGIFASTGSTARARALAFRFRLRPGGDLHAGLRFTPAEDHPLVLRPDRGIYFRACAGRMEMDGYSARWYLRLRVRGPEGPEVTYRTEDLELTRAWQGFWVSARDFGRATGSGLFGGGATEAKVVDLAFVPNTEKYRYGSLALDALQVWAPGPRVPGQDTDGDGIPDRIDLDQDNDGTLDFTSAEGPIVFTHEGYVLGGGRWTGRFTIPKPRVTTGDKLTVNVTVTAHSPEIARMLRALPGVVGILSGERRYDARGRYRAFSNHMMSGLLTPSGLPIENFQPLVCTRHVTWGGVTTLFSSPIDVVARVTSRRIRHLGERVSFDFRFEVPITAETPEGHYRLFFECGVVNRQRRFTRLSQLPDMAAPVNQGASIRRRPRDENLVFEKKTVLPLIRIGRPADPRLPWALLFDTEVHGVRGIVPEEDRGVWALNARNRLGSRPIYPPGTYRLEPGFPSLAYESLNIDYPLNPRSGELSVEITDPDGKVTDLGTAPFRAMTRWGATTRTGRFHHAFRKYGAYRVRMAGWIRDAYGNRLEGGGTYRLWIAERITFGTFPSLPYEVGQPYLGAGEIIPPVPARFRLEIDFYPGSDARRKRVYRAAGRASDLGLFRAHRPIVFPEPGEYLSRLSAQFTDADGRLWMGSLWGANVVAPRGSVMVGHGCTGYMVNGNYVPTAARYRVGEHRRPRRGDNRFLYYPFHHGDVLWVPSTMDHMNSIFPICTMSFRDGFVPYGNELGKRPIYPLRPTTSTGHSPYCFPEKVNRLAYFYGDAWRPGVSGRHLVGTAQTMNSYWSVSPSLLGRQMHTSRNGDLPGDFYRFTGGLVYRDLETGKARYAIYLSTGAVTAAGETLGEVAAPGTKPLLRMNGRDHYLFLGGGVLPLPGMLLVEGGRAPTGGSANPPVPADLTTTVIAPSGRTWRYDLEANWLGIFARSPRNFPPLVEPGVWRARQRLAYGGKTGDVLGSEDGEYLFYVLPADPARRVDLGLDLPPVSRLGPNDTVGLFGRLPPDVVAGTVHCTAISPGVILEETSSRVEGGTYCLEFDPWETGRRLPFFDTRDELTGRPVLSDTVVLTLFLDGHRRDGTRVYGHRIVILRGGTVINLEPEVRD